MKTTVKFLILIMISFVILNFECNYKEKQKEQIKKEAERLLIGTWRAYYGIQPCKYAQITFNEDGTGEFTYLGENDSLIIDPPCNVSWYVYAKEYSDWNWKDKEIKAFLVVIRLEKRCVGCERRWSDPPDTTIYLIDYLNGRSMKVELFSGGHSMTTRDMFHCEGGSIFVRHSKILYRQE